MASKYLNLSTDDTLGGNTPSDYLTVSQKAIKTYVDNNATIGTPITFFKTDGTTLTLLQYVSNSQ